MTMPQTIARSVLVLRLLAVLGVISGVINAFTFNYTPEEKAVVGGAPGSLAVVTVTAVITLILWFALAAFVAKGKSWARVVVMILAALNVLNLVVVAMRALDINLVVALIMAAGAVYAALLLRKPESDEWFARGGMTA